MTLDPSSPARSPRSLAPLRPAALVAALGLAAPFAAGTRPAPAAPSADLASAATATATLREPAIDRLEALAAARPGTVRLIRPLAGDPDFVVAEIGAAGRPALLVVGGLDGRHAIGVDAAVGIAEAMAADAARLERMTVYVVPRMVGDVLPSGRVAVPDDADDDGRLDEDAPRDLDGDGLIRMMRIADPSPLSGLVATHVVDPDDARIMRPAEDGETPTHAMLSEGLDADGDGRFAEDASGGIDANADWPALWPEFQDGTGAWPLSLARTRALADWMIDTPNLAMVLTHAPGDSLASVPVTKGTGPAGRVPVGILEADEAAATTVAEAFVAAMGIDAPKRAARTPGSLDAWAYGHLGLWSFATPLWDRPDRFGELASPAATDGDEADGDGVGVPDDSDGSDGSDADSDDARWLAWIDDVRGGEGFTPWTAFEHPQLGRVEIGGFDPRLAVTPPADLAPAIVERHIAFVATFADLMPGIEIDRVEHRDVGGGLHDLAVVLRNPGGLPTRPAMAARARRLAPTLVRLDVDAEAIVGGEPLRRVERIEPSAPITLRWRVRSDDPASITVTVTDPIFGSQDVRFDRGEED